METEKPKLPPHIRLNRSIEIIDLMINDPYAFTLLSIIAIRAKWKNNETGRYSELKTGECYIGRKEISSGKYSMTAQNYRSALKRLEKKYMYVTTKATRQGTIVKLLGTITYDINSNDTQHTSQPTGNTRPTHGQHTANTRPTTNNNVNNINNLNKGNYDPDLRLTVLNVRGEKVDGTLGEILNGIFSRYPGNANFHDRPAVAHFIMANPEYPLSMAVSREISQEEKGIPSRNIQNFINNPPDELQVRSWFKRNNNE